MSRRWEGGWLRWLRSFDYPYVCRSVGFFPRKLPLCYQKIVPVFQNVMAAAFVTVRLYDRRFSPNREVLLGWVSWRNVDMLCMSVQWGFSLISRHQKRASLSLARLHHILVSAIRVTRQKELKKERERGGGIDHRLQKDNMYCTWKKKKCMSI